VRSGKAAVLSAIVSLGLIVGAVPIAAQQSEEFPGPSGTELQGYTRSDGTIVLTDEAFCAYVLGSLWDRERLTFGGLLDKSRKQQQAKAGAFEPGADEPTLARCAEIVAAFRDEAPEDDTLAPWARRSPVVPESLAGLLPDDFVADPLAVAASVLDAARTSGFGSVVSAPFLMEEETWLVQVDAAACPVWTGSLRNARDAEQVIAVDDNREYLYNVAPGHYYWDVTASDCDWSVDLAAVPIGPDPDATPVPRVAVPRLAGEDWIPRRLNETFLSATQARQAILDAGLVVGECVEQSPETEEPITAGRVWAQDPIAGTLLELGSAVNVTIVSDCDIVRGDRVMPAE
jgi:hypothetical protein